MIDAREQLAAALKGSYVVERLLGAGGMATVYLAHDVRHERKVALKVLRPELASALGGERFVREVRITAGLSHPHILPLLDSGDVAGQLYYVMPYAEGGTLRDRLKRERLLAVDSALEITRQVADALAHAHARGVLHRDIKPENILFQGGQAVVADFGIARAIATAGGENITSTGLALGTAAYMSPEQGSGDRELDARSDLYSLACVTYEMLTGEVPFAGPTMQAMLARRVTETPRPVSATRSSAPPSVDAALSRALLPLAADRFSSVEEFTAALTSPNAPTPSLALPQRRRMAWALAAVVLALAAAAYVLRGRLTPTSQGDDPPRIAVLPFENLGNADDEPFADGITDEVTSRLSEISGLRVVSRTSAKRFKGQELSIAELGKALNADYILEGTVRTDRAPGGVGAARVTPQLIRVSDDVHVWQQRFDASLSPGDIFRVQADIARQVASNLRVTLRETERARIAMVTTTDSAAYRLYQLGRFHWDKRDAPSLLRAAQYFREAIAKDSNFADAYAGFAVASISYLLFYAPDTGFAATESERAAARRAVELDSASAAAQAGLGFSLMVAEWNWAAADSAFQRAITIDPEYGPARYWYTQLLWALDRLPEALQQAEVAVAVDPLSAIAHLAYGRTLRLLGREEESIAALKRVTELAPTQYAVYGDLTAYYARHGRHDEALQNAKLFLLHSGHASDDALAKELVETFAGRGKAHRIGRLLDGPGVRTSHVSAARWFAFARMRDSAFARLRAAVAARSLELYFIPPNLAPRLADDPRWSQWRSSMGLP